MFVGHFSRKSSHSGVSRNYRWNLVVGVITRSIEKAQATLKAFEGLQKGNAESDIDNSAFGLENPGPKPEMTIKQKAWALLEQPYSSKYAQVSTLFKSFKRRLTFYWLPKHRRVHVIRVLFIQTKHVSILADHCMTIWISSDVWRLDDLFYFIDS